MSDTPNNVTVRRKHIPLLRVNSDRSKSFDQCCNYNQLNDHFRYCTTPSCCCKKYYEGTVFQRPLYTIFESQSGVTPPNVILDMTAPQCDTHQNVCFDNDDRGTSYAIENVFDSTRNILTYKDATLGEFLRRPVKISTISWTTATGSTFTDLNPWTLFFTDPAVANKIKNYFLVRCKLHVRFFLDGGPFYYGRLLASYTPLFNDSVVENNRSGSFNDCIAASQRPHIYLDPCTSEGGVMVLPFLWPKDYMYAMTSTAEWADMGLLNVRSLSNLKHANGATGTINITVYAWAEDVDLLVPTSQSEVFESQSEYAQGIISKPLSSAASLIGKLNKVVTIGPYAKATQMTLSGMSELARLLGFSRPTILTDIMPMRSLGFGMMSVTDRSEVIQKLSTDSKQELSIDPRIAGLGDKDEMSLSHIAARESFLTKFAWTIASTPDSLLFSIAVTPAHLAVSGVELSLTPMCFAALPFQYWRGTLYFRFVIVASAHHKGRIRLTYDPYAANVAPTNVNYTRVVDIAETKDFTIPVAWSQDTGFKLVDSALAQKYSTASVVASSPTTYNGILSAYVANSLTSPNSTPNNDIEVLVFVSAGEDFEVAAPFSEVIDNLSVFTAQSEVGALDPSATAKPMDGEPLGQNLLTTIGGGGAYGSLYDVYFGEKISSIRSCIKRYTTYTHVYPNSASRTSGSTYLWTINAQAFPFARGYDPNGGFTTTGVKAKKYHPVNQTMLSYFSLPFLARRGGVRYKITTSANQTQFANTIQCQRYNTSTTNATISNNGQVLTIGTAEALSVFVNNFVGSNWDGQAAGTNSDGSGLEVEIPYYSNLRFELCRRTTATVGVAYNAFVTWLYYIYNPSGYFPSVTYYVAAAEDMSFHFFLSVPVMYSYAMSTSI